MQDAISANAAINSSHFNSFHTYKLEWQPGAQGYLDWYLDDEFLFGISASALEARTGALIPEVAAVRAMMISELLSKR